MHFMETLSRITGFSTPVFGVSWNPPQADVTVARRVVTFLEDRRVLYDPTSLEIEEHCIASVLEIRGFLTEVLTNEGESDELTGHLRAMRAACRKFLREIGREEAGREIYLPRYSYSNGLDDYRLNQALGQLRGSFGIHIAHLAVKYGLEVEDQLAIALPEPGEDSKE